MSFYFILFNLIYFFLLFLYLNFLFIFICIFYLGFILFSYHYYFILNIYGLVFLSFISRYIFFSVLHLFPSSCLNFVNHFFTFFNNFLLHSFLNNILILSIVDKYYLVFYRPTSFSFTLNVYILSIVYLYLQLWCPFEEGDFKGTNGRQKTYEVSHVYSILYSGFMCQTTVIFGITKDVSLY